MAYAFPQTNAAQMSTQYATNESTRNSVISSQSPLVFRNGAPTNSNFVIPASRYVDASGLQLVHTELGNVRLNPQLGQQKMVVGFTRPLSEQFAGGAQHLMELYAQKPEYVYMKNANQRNMAQRKNFESRGLGTLVSRPSVPTRGDMRIKVKDAKMMFDPGFYSRG
jgi:hypothetical protein